MVRCANCGAENREGAKFCDQCMAMLESAAVPAAESGASESQSFQVGMEDMGKRMGQDMQKLSTDFTTGTQKIGKDFSNWYDTRFGLVGPIISALVGILILVLALVILAVLSGEHPFWVHLRDFVILFLPLFIALSVFDRYADYFRRKRVKRYRVIDPGLTGIAIVAWFWIGIQVLLMMGEDMGWNSVEDFASSLEDIFLVVALLVVAIGVLLSLQRMIAPEMFMPPKVRGPDPPKP